MVDWKQSLPQIVASVIGSGLIVAALSNISSIMLKPILDISVLPNTPTYYQNMKYCCYKKYWIYASYQFEINNGLS